MIESFYQNINISQFKKLTFSKNETMTSYHTHYPVEMVYCVSGAFSIEYIDNKGKTTTLVLGRNMLCVIKSLVKHKQYAVLDDTSILLAEFSNKDNYESDVFSNLSSSFFPFDTETVQILYSLPDVVVFKDSNLKFHNNMTNIFDLLQHGEINNIFYVKYYAQVLDLFCNIAIEQKQAKPAIIANKYIRVATIYIKEHYFEPTLSVSEIAKAVNISEVYLQKLFKSIYNKTIKQYITEKRLTSAKTLLKTEMPFSQIAKNVGYNNYVTFYNECIKQENISPSEYRSKLMKENTVIKKL